MHTRNPQQKSPLLKGFSFNGWEVKPLAGKLSNEAEEFHLEPRIMDVLVCLASHQGEVVTRDVLLSEVWGKVVVSDDAITRCISELRTLLGDTERERAYIRTVPRRGYTFLLPVLSHVEEEVPEASAGEQQVLADKGMLRSSVFLVKYVLVFVAAVISVLAWQKMLLDDGSESALLAGDSAEVTTEPPKSLGKAEAADSIKALAVLPFVNLGPKAENDFFADGVSEDIRNALMSSSDLRIAARTSSLVFKDKPMDIREIGDQLNVDALLEGTVRIDGQRLRITTQLTRAENGYAIWAASFERDLADKIQLQSEIALEITKQIMPSLSTSLVKIKGTTANRAAQDYYFLGRHNWHQRTPESLEQAVNYFRQALKLDNKYARAWSGLADALIFQTSYDDKPVEKNNGLAKEAVEKALELEPELAEAHASYGMYLYHTGNIAGASKAYERAIELNPQNSMAHMWWGNILIEDNANVKLAYTQYEEALKYDPLHPQVRFNHAMALTAMGKYHTVKDKLEQYLKSNPHNMFLGALMGAHLDTGHYDEVLNLAVTYNLGEEHKHKTLSRVIEALIELNRFEQAEKLLGMSQASMGLWEYGWIRSRLAMAKSHGPDIIEVAKYFEKNQNKFKHPSYAECVGMMNVYLRGVANYLERDYAASLEYFNKFEDTSSNQGCLKMEIKLETTVLLYRAVAMHHLGEDDKKIQELMKVVDDRLNELSRKGWNTPEMAKLEIARYAISNNQNKVLEVVKRMNDLGWRPYGMINSSPILREVVQSSEVYQESFAALSQDYETMKSSCDSIVLAKIGL